MSRTPSPNDSLSNDDVHVPDDDGSTAVSKELLEREKAFREKNKQLCSKTAHIIQEAERVVSNGLTTLSTASFQGIQIRDETEKNSRPRSATAGKRSTAPRPNHAQARPSTASASIGSTRPSENRAKSGQKPKDVSIDEIADQLAVKLALPQIDAIHSEMVEGLGEEATERFLRAKVVVLTNELDNVMTEIKEKDVATVAASERAKTAEEERNKTARIHSSLQKEHDKVVRQAEALMKRNEVLETELLSVRKELEHLTRSQKHAESESGTRDIRLNRALEEADRCKTLATRAQQEAKESIETARTKADRWAAECKRLEKQKQELLMAFKKQAQLVEVLKRQKMHIAAAKLLEFTEEEFIKTLDWKA